MTDFTLETMAEHLWAVAEAMPMGQHNALAAAAHIVETEAKAEIGHYQGAAGPFAAWASLAESTLEKKAANTPLLETGEMRDSIGSIVGSDQASVGSNDDKAVWQELGTVKIPPRSFLGGAAVRKSAEVRDLIGHTMVAALIKPETSFTNGKEVVIPIPGP